MAERSSDQDSDTEEIDRPGDEGKTYLMLSMYSICMLYLRMKLKLVGLRDPTHFIVASPESCRPS